MILRLTGKVFRLYYNFILSKKWSSAPYVNSKTYMLILMQKQIKKTLFLLVFDL